MINKLYREQDIKEKHFEVEELQDKFEDVLRKAQDEIQDLRNKHKNQTAKVSYVM